MSDGYKRLQDSGNIKQNYKEEKEKVLGKCS